MALPVNDDLLADRYDLAEVIGVGGMAEVRRAWDTLLRRPVAVKMFTADSDLANARRFDNEVRVLAGLSHPGLVSVYDAGTSGTTRFVVLRLVDGQTLRHRMADGPMPVDEVRAVGAAVCDALAHVHEQGVVHRDIKPSNILLDEEGTPFLADFGLAHSIGSTRLTRTGLIVGTAAYLAPEQVRGAEVGSAADVYALGLVLLECLTGRCEYTGSDVEAIVSRLHRSPVIPAHLPADVARLLSLMTSQSPGRRPSARQCAELLRAARLTAVSTVRPPSPRGKVLVAAAALLLGVVGVGWAVAPGPTAPAPDSPGAAEPAAVQPTTPAGASVSAASETAAAEATETGTPALLAAVTDADQPAPAVNEPVQPQEPVHEQAKGPGPGSGPGSQHGPGKEDKPVPPGQEKKGKP